MFIPSPIENNGPRGLDRRLGRRADLDEVEKQSDRVRELLMLTTHHG